METIEQPRIGNGNDKFGHLVPPGGAAGDGAPRRDGGRRLQEAVGTALSSDGVVTGTLDGLVRFEVCPGSVFDFASSGPVVVETPSVHGLHVGCLRPDPLSGIVSDDGEGPSDGPPGGPSDVGDGCLFTGGSNHVLFNSDGYSFSLAGSDPLYGTSTGSSHVTLSGITFEGATAASVLMNDPRGRISFQDCTWSNNAGEGTIVIDGRYVPPTMAPTRKPIDWMKDVVVWTGTSSTIDWSIFNFDTTSANVVGDGTTPFPGDEESEEEEPEEEPEEEEEEDDAVEDPDATGDIGLDAGEAPEEGTAGGGGTTQATAVSVADGGASEESSETGSTEAATSAAPPPSDGEEGEEEAPAGEFFFRSVPRSPPRDGREEETSLFCSFLIPCVEGLGRLIPHTFFPRFLPCLLFQSSEKSGPNVHSRRRPRRGRPRGGRRVRRRPRLPRRDQQEGRHADLRRVPQLAPPGREQEPVQEGERRRDAGQGLLQEDLSELREEEEEEADGRVRRRRTGLCRHGGEVSTGGRGRDAVVAGHGAEVCHLAREVRVRGKSVLPSSHVCSPS